MVLHLHDKCHPCLAHTAHVCCLGPLTPPSRYVYAAQDPRFDYLVEKHTPKSMYVAIGYSCGGGALAVCLFDCVIPSQHTLK